MNIYFFWFWLTKPIENVCFGQILNKFFRGQRHSTRILFEMNCTRNSFMKFLKSKEIFLFSYLSMYLFEIFVGIIFHSIPIHSIQFNSTEYFFWILEIPEKYISYKWNKSIRRILKVLAKLNEQFVLMYFYLVGMMFSFISERKEDDIILEIYPQSKSIQRLVPLHIMK